MHKYWEMALGHQQHGYYMKRDVFNTKGDFITSVEISQMFGEILGIWVINLLSKINAINLDVQQEKSAEKKFSLMEFGPGKGTLMCDIIKVLHQFNLLNGIEINFIEMSPFMRKLQQESVMKIMQERGIYLKYENYAQEQTKLIENEMEGAEGEEQQKPEFFSNEDTDNMISVRWFSTYEEMVLKDFGEQTLSPKSQPLNFKKMKPYAIIAHEFFDALPTNIFQYVEGKGWREKLINISHGNKDGQNFEYILSEAETENVKKLLNPSKMFSEQQQKDIKDGDSFEIQPRSAVIANAISELIAKANGGALIIDYGEDYAFSDSIRGIRKHKFIKSSDVLEYPGEVDLSAYVNFKHLASAAKQVPGIEIGGPIPQGLFLESMGLNARLEALCKISNKKTAQRLESEYFRLVAPEEMGEVYKCFYIGKKENGEMFPFISADEQQAFY